MTEDQYSAVVLVLTAIGVVLMLICFLREDPTKRAKENR